MAHQAPGRGAELHEVRDEAAVESTATARRAVFERGDEDPAARAVTAAATSAAHSVEQGPISTPGREGVGAQVKVLVNRKVYKEFTRCGSYKPSTRTRSCGR